MLAGWSSNNKYAMMGGLRSTAQMISYEIALGLSFVGVILLAGNRNGLPWTEYTPPAIKLSIVGNGAAEKKQVQYMVTKLLNLPQSPKPDDVADALAIAICHALRMRTAAQLAQ